MKFIHFLLQKYWMRTGLNHAPGNGVTIENTAILPPVRVLMSDRQNRSVSSPVLRGSTLTFIQLHTDKWSWMDIICHIQSIEAARSERRVVWGYGGGERGRQRSESRWKGRSLSSKINWRNDVFIYFLITTTVPPQPFMCHWGQEMKEKGKTGK